MEVTSVISIHFALHVVCNVTSAPATPSGVICLQWGYNYNTPATSIPDFAAWLHFMCD